MSDDVLTGAAHESPILVRSEPERLIELRIVPWNVVGNTPEGAERFRRGAFRGVKPADVALEAIGPHGADAGVRLAGRAVELADRDDGEYGTFRVSRTVAGDELLELARDGVYRAASAVFVPGASRLDGGVIERQTARLVRVGIVETGAYPGAEVLAVRSAATGGVGTMATETEPIPQPEPPAPPTPPQPEPPEGARIAADTPGLVELRRDMLARFSAMEAFGTGRAGGPHPLARWDTFGEYLRDASADPDTAALLARALADQTTTDNPGVVPPGYLTEVHGIVTVARPAIAALGGPQSLGESGMSLHYPYYNGNLSLLVGKQATEKTEITSVKVNLLDGAAPIATYAGGSDVSYQLIRRSSPPYLEAYGRIMLAGWALTTEKEFELAIHTLATGTIVFPPATATLAQWQAYAFAASAKVKSATGLPADVILADSVSWAKLGSLLVPGQYGTFNVPGTAQASTLAISLSGLAVVEAPYFPADKVVATNSQAVQWHEDGPMVATAEDVARLGQNRAYWSMGATTAYVPAGIVENTLVQEDAEATSARKAREAKAAAKAAEA